MKQSFVISIIIAIAIASQANARPESLAARIPAEPMKSLPLDLPLLKARGMFDGMMPAMYGMEPLPELPTGMPGMDSLPGLKQRSMLDELMPGMESLPELPTSMPGMNFLPGLKQRSMLDELMPGMESLPELPTGMPGMNSLPGLKTRGMTPESSLGSPPSVSPAESKESKPIAVADLSRFKKSMKPRRSSHE